MSDVIRQNAVYWEVLAAHRQGEPVEAIRGGAGILGRAERDAFGDPAGRWFLQVAASVGDESLALALAGAARVTAVDLAPTHVATGQAKAHEVGVEVDFRVGDMTALDDDLRGVDVIHVSWGGLCWVPDLDPWIADLADRLTPGGRLVIAEHHPVWEVLSVVAPDQLAVTASYFDQDWRGSRDLAKEPEVVAELGQGTPPHTSFIWGIGQVVTAMIRAGLAIISLEEGGHPEMYPGLDASAQLPSTYVLAGLRPLG